MNIRLTGDGDQVADTVAALEKTPGLRITKTSRPYANWRDPEQMRVYLDVEVDNERVVDAAIGGRGLDDLNPEVIDGRWVLWLVLDGVGGYVCAEPVTGQPDDICGMPVESEPCSIHYPEVGSC